MSYIVQAVGLAIIAAGLVVLAQPSLIRDLVPKLIAGKAMFLLAGLRVLIGCGLILAAAETRHPLVIEIFGWLAVFAGLMMLVLPPKVMQRIGAWVDTFSDALMRAVSPLILAVGGYLVWVAL